jgi:hypothetical protein
MSPDASRTVVVALLFGWMDSLNETIRDTHAVQRVLRVPGLST